MQNLTSLPGWWDARLVALSVVVAMCAAFSALDLAARTAEAKGWDRLAWLAGGATAMGTGIWSMHYIGMLAFHLPIPVLYDVPTVVVSLLAAIFASAIALWVVSRNRLTPLRLGLGSLVMGGGIVAMHYTGMAAMRMPAACHYNAALVALSVVIAVVVSLVAMLLAFYFRAEKQDARWLKFASAAVMGVAVASMHYTAMAAASFTPAPGAGDVSRAVRVSALGGFGIAAVTGMILGLAVLTSILRKRATTALRQSEERTRLILESALDAVITIGAEGLITGWNHQAESTFGWSCEEVLGRELATVIIPAQYRELHRQGLKRFLATGEGPVLNQRIEITALHRDGHEFPVELAISVAKSGEQHVFSAFIRDITDRKQRQEALERSRDELEARVLERTAQLAAAKDAAEAASRAKSEFLANMSHEIRTPMNGVMGMMDLIFDTGLTEEQRDYLTTVKISADSLMTVINDILDFSKIEAGKLEFDPIEFKLRDSLEDTVRSLALRAHQKGLELNCDFKPGVPEVVFGDPVRLRQVIVNLVGNSIKFTGNGEVTLLVELESLSEDHAVLHFSVADTGIGISPEKQKTIFDAFAQADTSTTRKYGGTGLGLTISSCLIRMMQGHIWLESEVGKGSVFHFKANFGIVRASPGAPPAPPADLAGIPTLIVDDNPTNRRILQDLLCGWGMAPACVEGGEAALKVLRRARDAGARFKLVLADVNMPEMDGFQLAEHIKQDPELAGATIMLLTSGGQRGDAARCRELGVSAYLMKPVRQGELLEAVTRVLAGSGHAGASVSPLITRHSLREASGAGLVKNSKPLRLLLVEDNPINQKIAQRLLERQGHLVVHAANGKQALAALEKQGFDAILMDIQMPEMDGLEATSRIRRMEQTSGLHVPIIAMTAHAMEGDRERCLNAGMDHYISKPIRAADLYSLLELISQQTPNSGVDAPVPSSTGQS